MSPLVLLLGCGGVNQEATTSDAVFGVELPPPVGEPIVVDPPEDDPVDPPDTPTNEPVEPGPRIVVVLHGMLTNGGDVGELGTGRGYWSFEFTRGLLGVDSGSFETLAGTTISSNTQWVSEGDAVGRISARTAPHAFAFLPDTRSSSRLPRSVSPFQRAEAPPLLSVMMTARDASIGLLRQSRSAAQQIETLVDWYQNDRFAEYFAECNCEPQLILVGHSMGGLVIRTILSNPRVSATNAALNPDGTIYSNAVHDAMDMIRDHTVFATTLATPHDGTIVAERAQDLITLAEQLPQVLAGVSTSDPALASAATFVRAMLSQMGQSAPSQQQIANALTRFAMDINPLRGALRDLTRTYMGAVNGAFLHPNNARRTNAADQILGAGTGGALVPIYTFGGRSPGSVHFDTFDLPDAISGFSAERPGDQTNILLKLLLDQWMSHYPNGYGTVGGALAPFATQLDRVARVSFEPALADVAENVAETAINDAARLAILVGGDSVPGWVRAFLGVQLPEAEINLPIFLNEQWSVSMTGQREPPRRRLQLRRRFPRRLADRRRPSGPDRPRGEPQPTDAGHSGQRHEPSGGRSPSRQSRVVPAERSGAVVERHQRGVRRNATRRELPGATGWNASVEYRAFPAPVFAPNGAAISDGEVDTDGAVTYDSAMGLSLGGASTFERCGAWQRRFDSPFEPEYHEGLNIRGHLGRYLHDDLVVTAGASACRRR